MASNISPGVYTKIIDLSTFVQQVPSTIGFITGLTKKGEDNKLKFFSSRSEFIAEMGEPNIADFGTRYGQGSYCAYNYLGDSGSLFFIRAMPDTAAFANIYINAEFNDATEEQPTMTLSYVSSANASNLNELQTALEAGATTFPLCVLRPIGRGEYYNNLSVRLVQAANPMLSGVYILDIYETQADGSEVIVESFEVSFDPRAVDSTGDSVWIQNVLASYSGILRCEMELANGEYSEGHELIIKDYDSNIGVVSVVETDAAATLTDTKQDFSQWATGAAPFEFMVILKDGTGNELTGFLGAASGVDNETVDIWDARLVASAPVQNFLPRDDVATEHADALTAFDEDSEITYVVKKSSALVGDAFTDSDPVPLKKGSDGLLFDSQGRLFTDDGGINHPLDALSDGYAGLLKSAVDGTTLVDDVFDSENIYFSLVFDCGYPTEVKQQISALCQTRRDCMGIMDNGNNDTYSDAMTARLDDNTFNNYFVALFESYNKVYDTFTGRDVWFSPIYHMSYLMPRNDRIGEIWFAAAGFNRGSIDSIKELKYNPRLGQRDQMYLKQLNPIVKFNPGYTVFGQLTSQAKPSALQDINIVRLVLYAKRALEQYCRFFIFEQNDAITWSSVAGDINLFLEQIKKKRGLYNYSVDVGATEYEKKTKTFHVNVTLEPTRVVEKIELNFFIK